MMAMAGSGVAEIVAVADNVAEVADSAARAVGASAVDVDALLAGEIDVDGIAIATPSGLHAEQSIVALGNGFSVFCQKPLARNAAECEAVVEAARAVDRFIDVDFSYRHLRAVQCVHDVVSSGAIGAVYAAELVFHNAYGPDKSWYRDPERSGGGCVIDLGIHLVDLALWLLEWPAVDAVSSRLFAGGRSLSGASAEIEDYAVARLDLEGGATVQLACSWNLPAGQDAIISATFYGSDGGVSLRNVGGSFYDFVAERYDGTNRSVLAEPPDEWGGRAACRWVQRLTRTATFDADADRITDVARVIDRIYAR